MAVIDLFPALFENYFIKIIFLAHVSLTTLANIASFSSSFQETYTPYNLVFHFVTALAILVDKNVDIVLVATALSAICIPLDILLVLSKSYIGSLCIILVVMNLFLRPVSTILLLKNYSARAGVEDPTGGLLEVHVQAPIVPRARSAYQNIDEPNQTLP